MRKKGECTALYHKGYHIETEILSSGACKAAEISFGKSGNFLEKIREQEKEVEELSVESDRLRS